MTTPTPTSNAPGVSGLALPTGDVPAGLPDVAALAQLANAFFTALPGSEPEPTIDLAPVGTSPQLSALPVADAAPIAPQVPVLGVPTQYAAALPQVASGHGQPVPAHPVSAPSSPYYFLGEASGYQSAVPHAGVAASEAGVPDDRVSAQPFHLPGTDALARLIDGVAGTPPAGPAALQQRGGAAQAGQFYFLAPPTVPTLEASRDTSHQPHRASTFDVQAVRRDFPILAERVNGRPLIWLDNAATTHKPQAVIDRLAYFYAHENSNIHRAAHELAARATDAYEGARNKVARFLGAKSSSEIIFVRGATEAINLVAQTFGRQHIGAGDEIIVSHLEHHANIVPWQQLAAQVGARIRVIPVDDSGQVLLDEYRKLLSSRTKLVSVTQVSNALGTVTPVQEIIALAHAAGARVLVDGAQAVSHLRVNVQALDADFYVFSGHKIFGPTGIGVVYGKQHLLDTLPPWQGGGNMIADVTFEKTLYQPAPARFEAGTGNIADAVGLGAALDYVDRIGLENIARYEHDLLVYATHGLSRIPGLRLIGTAANKASVLSFTLAGYRTEEVGAALNREGIAVRSGHHCAQPILRRFGVEATVRPSLAFYNTCEEVDELVRVVGALARR
ncbi:family 2A encapsulin nanocompartment cargo protein cysteine desulfurase (plasmid) [Ralstonia sp. 25C]|uniref:family 2A encapsulin nanocompartment cargo protein cysteine desulfurase n=1 Tax=Ralstonia sp. 25C TaxID=3447363 RepID=UPI003F7558EE